MSEEAYHSVKDARDDPAEEMCKVRGLRDTRGVVLNGCP